MLSIETTTYHTTLTSQLLSPLARTDSLITRSSWEEDTMPTFQNIRRRTAEEAENSTSSRKTKPVSYNRRQWNGLLLLVAAVVVTIPSGVSSFTLQSPISRTVGFSGATLLQVLPNGDDAIDQSLKRARALLEKSKAKLAAQEDINAKSMSGGDEKAQNLPFFASQTAVATSTTDVADDVEAQRRDRVTKSRDETTGLITIDGEKMAAMSEQEEWEERSLVDLFENEGEDIEGRSPGKQKVADRDVAMSIFNLRRVLQVEDYLKIFDKKNWFIGEDN
jgi:hypothetical protein